MLLLQRRIWIKCYLHFAVKETSRWEVATRRQVVVADAEKATVFVKRKLADVVFEF